MAGRVIFEDNFPFANESGANFTEVGNYDEVEFRSRLISLLMDKGGAVYNVKAFGAKGDGVTNDDAALAAAAAKAAPLKGVVLMPPGIYVLSGSWNVPAGITIQGSGVDSTILKTSSSGAGWGPGSALINCTNQATVMGVHVYDLTVDGNRRTNVSSGQGISVGNGWIVERVKFYDISSFKLWINACSYVTIRDCIWKATASDADNIGGGGACYNVLIDRCFWDSDVSGNCLDLTTASYITVRNCHFQTGGFYFEGVTDSIIDGNSFNGRSIVLQTEAGYNSPNLAFPRNNRIINNKIFNSPNSGAGAISINYNDYAGATTRYKGGGNIVAHNVIENSGTAGVIVFGDGYKDTPDSVLGNTITNTNKSGSSTINTGNGIWKNAGITLGIGANDLVIGNTISDNQASPTTEYGISVTGTATAARVVSPTIGPNTIANVSISTHNVANPAFLTGLLRVDGTAAGAISSKTSAYSLTSLDGTILASASGGAFSVTLPNTIGIAGREYTIKKIDSSGNAVTVATTSSQTIDGAASYSLGSQWKYVTVQSDGANWIIVGNN